MKAKSLFTLLLVILMILNTIVSSAEGLATPMAEGAVNGVFTNPDGKGELGKYRLAESAGNLTLWTDWPSERIFKDSPVPSDTCSGIQLYMAKNEFEPFQLIVNPKAAAGISVEVLNSNVGIDVELHKVMYINLEKSTDNLGRAGLYPDPLYPMNTGETLSLSAGVNQPIWFTLHTKETVKAGDYSLTVSVGGVKIPVQVHVFDFAIPKELHVDSQINVSMNSVLEKYGVTGTTENYWRYVDGFKQFFMDHRLTPRSVLWSGGLTGSGGSPYIDYNSSTGIFKDPHGIWGFEYPASRYLAGKVNTQNKYLPQTAFNSGVGFPSFQGITFKNNDASADQRPDVFDGTKRQTSDWYTANNINSPYNKKWFKYIRDMEAYLKSAGYLNKAYYYFANEPQDQADYDAVSWYSQELKKAAPGLKLMVSEEPKPEIFNNPKYPGAKIDQWLAVLNKYNPEVSWKRQSVNNEETWIYFLYGTKPPHFNPITLDHPGIESKLTGWFLWKYRINGIAHYSFNNWSKNVWQNPMTSGQNGDDFMLYPPSQNNAPIQFGATNHRFVSSIRFELLRDSLEDYEYLYLLNNGQKPVVYQSNRADSEADKIVSGLTSYNRSSETMYTLRKYIGLNIEKAIATIPPIVLGTQPPGGETKQPVYINFQDPKGAPLMNPLIVNGKQYQKIGWNPYDAKLGYGWYGDMAHALYKFLDNAPDVLKGSILYDDWGREKTFEYDLPNGKYSVTVSCGWQGKTYKRNKITIEGVSFINDEATNPYLVRTKVIEVKDQKLTLEMGIFDEYTMLNSLEIEPVN